MKYSIFLYICFLGYLGCSSSGNYPDAEEKRVKTGAEVLLDEYLPELDNKRVGLIMNPTARIGKTHMVDTLISRNVNVSALFAPEHGFRGEAGAGEIIENGIDRQTGLPVYSLYGESKKPAPEMLNKVDLLLFDMQDVGARFYTYNVTMGLVIEAAAKHEIPVWILDRPNPAGGEYTAGWVLQEKFSSFVGAYPIPMAHGMTLGELALMMVGEKWLNIEKKPQLKVIQMENWQRSMLWPETGLEWIPPSPNLPTFEHAYLYLGTVLFEGTTISEGRGTDDPFLTIGSPGTDLSEEQFDDLRKSFPSVEIRDTTFTPVSIPGKAYRPRHEGQKCSGIYLSVRNYQELDPVAFGVELLKTVFRATPGAKNNEFIHKLAGTYISPIGQVEVNWQKENEKFKKLRETYLLY